MQPAKEALCVQCGGERAAVAAAEPYLKVMGRNIVYCGQPGNGQAAKVCSVTHILQSGIHTSFSQGYTPDIFDTP